MTGLQSPGSCPECARAFDLAVPSTYSTLPPFLRGRYWLPGFVAACCVMLAGLAVGTFVVGAWGWSLWIATPAAGGCIIGYATRTRLFWIIVLALAAATTFIMGMVSMGVGGVFCGMVLSGIVLGPVIAGALLGMLLRFGLKRSAWTQRWYLPVVPLGAMLLLCYHVDGPVRSGPAESVVTERVINASVHDAFDGIVFYEQVTHPPPWILRVGLARPLYTTGSSSAVGDVKTCVYNRGRIVKKITAVIPDRSLTFSVIDQHIGYEQDVRLTSGSFSFAAVDPTHTRIRLTTTYEPLLRPRWCWRWAESIGVHTLHAHVLEGIRLRAAGKETLSTAALGPAR